MDDIREIFEKDTAGTDLDAELAVAAEVLEKVAAQQGVDLNSLSQDQIAELLVELMPSKLAAEDEEHEEHEKKETMAEEKKEEERKKKAGIASPHGIPNTVTFADVAVELGKYAAANGIDLSQVSREAYHEAFDKMASAMTSPEFAAEKEAAAEMEAKLAEADVIGRVMARSFMDEQAKIANAPTAAAEAATKTLTEKGKEFLSRMSAGAGKKVDTALDYAKRNKAGLAVGAGTTAGGYMIGKGVGRYKQKKKMLGVDEEKNSSIEAAALEMARQALADNGIDPDTGKVASEEDQVRIRALEILKEAGWVE
jgi:hypothetical protein